MAESEYGFIDIYHYVGKETFEGGDRSLGGRME
jgi:hypothetical protein